MTANELKTRIKEAARRLGFDPVGVAPPGGWATADALGPWLAAGYAGEMAYMARDSAARADPRRRFPWARSVVVVALSYDGSESAPPAACRPFSRYAWGADYHQVMVGKLRELKAAAQALAGGPEGHYTVDTAPVLERAAAAAAGLGWLAKNAMLTNERAGSFLFLGTLFFPFEMEPDPAAPGRCGTCTRCLDACPTRAFVAPYVLDARRCISYLTIELRGPIPRDFRPLLGGMVFGCDLCQEVCPFNERAARERSNGRAPPRAARAAFRAREGLGSAALEDLLALLALDGNGFRERFRGSAVRRTKRRGLARNICVALGNRGEPAAVPALLAAFRSDPEPLVRGHAAWALGTIGARRAEARAGIAGALESGRADADPTVREEASLALDVVRRPPAGQDMRP